MFPDFETFTHPGEEVRQRIVSAPDTFWNTGTSACERQRSNTIWSNDHVRIRLGETNLRRKNIGRALFDATTGNSAILEELESRDFNFDVQFRIDEIPNIGINFPGSFKDDECSGLCNPEIYGLPRSRIGGIYATVCQHPISSPDLPLN